MFSLIYAVVSGFFSTKYEQYQLQREQLKLEVLYFEEKKKELINSNSNLTKLRDSLTNTLSDERNQADKLKNELVAKQKEVRNKENELNELKSTKTFYNEEIKQLQTEYNRKRKLFEKELEKQYISESDLTRRLKERDDKIGLLQNQIDILNYQVKVVDDNPYIQKNKKTDFAIWTSEQVIKYLEKDLTKNDEIRKLLGQQLLKDQKKLDSLNAKIKVKKMDN